MANTNKRLAWFGLAFIVGGAVGLVIGAYGSLVFASSSILNEALAGDARAVRSHVATLKHFRAGELEQAAESLEVHLDDELILFDPVESYPGLTAETISEIDKAIQEAKEYRIAHVRKSNRPFVDEMVKNLLARDRSR